MSVVDKEILIDAPPEEVFNLIANVKDFSRYSSFIKSVNEVSPGEFEWKIDMLGIALGWRARVVESTRPVKFAWESVAGIRNKGCYNVEPAGSGTRVVFRMEYHLSGRTVEALIAPCITQVISIVSDELLKNIKKALESEKSGQGSAGGADIIEAAGEGK